MSETECLEALNDFLKERYKYAMRLNLLLDDPYLRAWEEHVMTELRLEHLKGQADGDPH